MVVSQEHTGNIICLYESGERFLVSEVSAHHMVSQWEDGKERTISREVNGYVEEDPQRIAAFHRNRALAKALNAAEQAAHRHAEGHNPIERNNAARVLDIVEAQRTTLHAKLHPEQQPNVEQMDQPPAEEKNSFAALLASAMDRANSPSQQPTISEEHTR